MRRGSLHNSTRVRAGPEPPRLGVVARRGTGRHGDQEPGVPGQHLSLPGGSTGHAGAAVAHPATVRRDQGGVAGPLAGCQADQRPAARAMARFPAVIRAPGPNGSHGAERHRDETRHSGPAADEVGVAKLAMGRDCEQAWTENGRHPANPNGYDPKVRAVCRQAPGLARRVTMTVWAQGRSRGVMNHDRPAEFGGIGEHGSGKAG